MQGDRCRARVGHCRVCGFGTCASCCPCAVWSRFPEKVRTRFLAEKPHCLLAGGGAEIAFCSAGPFPEAVRKKSVPTKMFENLSIRVTWIVTLPQEQPGLALGVGTEVFKMHKSVLVFRCIPSLRKVSGPASGSWHQQWRFLPEDFDSRGVRIVQ